MQADGTAIASGTWTQTDPDGFASGTWNGSAATISGDGSVPKAGENPPDDRPESQVAEPVDTGTGAHVIQKSLLKVQGAQSLDFIADYDSTCHYLEGPLGFGWSHNYEAYGELAPNGDIILHWNAKRSNLFVRNPTNVNLFACSSVAVAYNSLVKNANSTYTLKQPDQKRYEFDVYGRLSQVVNPHGQAMKLTYVSTNAYPSQIQEAISGKTLSLTYGVITSPSNSLGSQRLMSISDGSGRIVKFAYDSSGRLATITRTNASVSRTYTYSYTSDGRIRSETNPDGAIPFYNTYDGAGRVTSQRDARSNYFYFSYSETQSNRLVTTMVDRTGATNVYVHNERYMLLSITDGLGQVTRYGYDTNGNRTSITNALGRVQRFTYDSAGNLVSSTDAAGQITTNQFDSRNNLAYTLNALNNRGAFTYDTNNNVLTATNYLTNVTAFTYTTNSLLTQVISPRGGKTSFAYVNGLLARTTNAVSNVTAMAYDTVGRLIAVTNAAGFVSTNAYDLDDNLIAMSDGLGNVWRYTYDSVGRRLTETDPLTNTTSFYYDGNGNLTNRTDALGWVTRFFYDAEDRLQKVVDANGRTNQTIYDAAGRLVATVDALYHTNSFQYDAVGNVVATVDALGVTNFVNSYDVRNLPTTTQNALGHQWTMGYDNLGRLIRTVDPLVRTNLPGYDAASQLVSNTDPMGFISRQQFDPDGNRTNLLNGLGLGLAFRYDAANRLTNTVTATGKSTSYAFDKRDFINQITQPSGVQTTLTNDAAGRLVQVQDLAGAIAYAYDKKGRLLTVTENGKTLTREYDKLDRLTKFTDGASNVLNYAYDPVGNLTNLTYPDGKQVRYAYDAANHLSSVTDWSNRITSYTYDANGRVRTITRPDQSTETFTYDAAGRMTRSLDLTVSSNVIHDIVYSYDSVGQIIAEDTTPAPTVYSPSGITNTFDADNRLVTINQKPAFFDANGNLTNAIIPGIAYSNFTYDVRNRLVSAGGVTNGYDAENRRISVVTAAGTNRFVINPNAALDQLLVNTGTNGAVTRYVYGLGLIGEETGTNFTTYHYDRRGSTTALTDKNGNITQTFSYGPNGEPVGFNPATTTTQFLYNGYYGVATDPNGLCYMRARYYSPAVGRFINQDVVLGEITRGILLNRFAYANGDPISNIDPLGLYWSGSINIGGTAGIGALFIHGEVGVGVAIPETWNPIDLIADSKVYVYGSVAGLAGVGVAAHGGVGADYGRSAGDLRTGFSGSSSWRVETGLGEGVVAELHAEGSKSCEGVSLSGGGGAKASAGVAGYVAGGKSLQGTLAFPSPREVWNSVQETGDAFYRGITGAISPFYYP